jgi:hypothetical protein
MLDPAGVKTRVIAERREASYFTHEASQLFEAEPVTSHLAWTYVDAVG